MNTTFGKTKKTFSVGLASYITNYLTVFIILKLFIYFLII